MASSSTPASRSRGAGGLSSQNGKGKHVKFFDLTLLIPNEPPGDLMFSIEENETSAAVRETFGDDQYVAIREKCKDRKLTLAKTSDALGALMRDCFEAWGFSAGE